jgi:hypothetical protein
VLGVAGGHLPQPVHLKSMPRALTNDITTLAACSKSTAKGWRCAGLPQGLTISKPWSALASLLKGMGEPGWKVVLDATPLT